ncbi:MAG TPA: mandelate racemase/muconate lactonizing enzyme family protein [Chloroflexota bacterium]|nr:mandelate racemase/muconate lactonizing enzyme family protein [Chloroflexota bacterium]
MKITGVRTKPFMMKLDRPLGDANDPIGRDRMASLAVYVDTDDGVTGISLGSPAARNQIHAMVSELLVGHDPRGVRGLWKKMIDSAFKGGNRGVVCNAIGALDVALWDAKAKANNEPLWKTLGASTRRVKAYASGIDLSLTDEQIAAFYGEMAQKGISAGKLKVGLDREADLRRLGIMREALSQSGRTPVLLIDSNEYWSPKQAMRNIQFLEQHFEITWAEEPARRWDYRGLRKVSQSIRAAVATGENLNEIGEFMPLVANEAVDVLNIGSGNSGITGALQIADLAYAFEIPVSMMNCPGNFMAHLAAALPNHWMMEVVGAGRENVLTVDNHIEGGWIVLGDQPGLGIAFDEVKLEEGSGDVPTSGSRASLWGRRRGAGLFEVPPTEPEWPEE